MGQSTQVLTYSPDIWVQVDTDSGQLDLSADVIQGQIQRIENGISQCALVINNKNAQYSNVLKPMDRITVWLQRITKVQVFSGYLNSAPFIDLYPTTATITASCSLKRLQHTWFNTGLPSTMDLLNQENYISNGKWADPSSNDYGIGKMLVEVLAQVANWDRSEIHIGNFPSQFLALYQKYVDLGTYETAITALENIMGLTPSSGATGNPSLVGNSNAAKIFNYLVTQGLSAIQAAAVIGNFMQESGCDPNSVQGGGGPGRGIAQWGVDARWKGVIALAAQLGGQPTDLSIQCAFVWQELNGPYASTLRALKAATDIVTAVTVFEQGYEAAGVPNMANRIAQANNALASFAGQVGAGAQSGTLSAGASGQSTVNSSGADATTTTSNGVTVTGAQIINAVEAYAGVPYNQANPQSRASGMDCCLVGSTRIYGPHNAKPISEIKPGDEVFSYENGKLTVNSVVASWQSKTQSVYKVRTRNRAVIASANHPFMRLAEVEKSRGCFKARYDVEWARVDELKRGDLLIQPSHMVFDRTHDQNLSLGTPITRDVAWLIGAMVGDGTVTERKVALCLFGEKRERAMNIIRDVWSGNPQASDHHGIQISNKKMADELNTLGLVLRGVHKRMPDAVWSWPIEQKIAFLNGYCDADGYRPQNTAQHGERTYSSCSYELIQDVRSLHIMIGDAVSNVSTNHRSKTIVIKGVEVMNALPLHSFSVWNGRNKSDDNNIKSRRLGVADWCNSGDFTVSKIIEITDEGVQDTYDLTIEKNHNFIADSIVVHNSGVVQAAMNDLGISIGRDTVQQLADAKSGKIGVVLPSTDPNQAQPGDIIHYNGHEEVWLGGGKVFSESTYGTVAAIRNLGGPGAITGIVRYAGLTGNGGTGSSGNNATTFDTALFNFLFQPAQFIDATASLWTGQLSLAGCTQLLPMVQAIAKGGLRSFQSGPNGDFIAYYPDYFGIAGSGTKMTIEDIEIKDLSIVKNDNSFTTHVFTAGDMSGTAGMGFSSSDISQWLGTAGVVTVEDADVMRLMLDIDPSTNPDYTSDSIYARYGARPLKIEFPTIGNSLGNGQGMEWFQAFHIFMQKWSEQYATNVDITFMPELFPGMRIWLGSHNVGVYISQVTHTIDRIQGFSTQLTISSPSTAPGNPIPGIPVEGGGVPTVS